MKITIVSTAYPLRGGIAQYVGILYNRLRDHGHDLQVITFRRQYPAMLFPGKTQMETSEDESVKIPSLPVLDSIGPLTWFKAAQEISAFKPDLILLKYWMPFFAPCFGTVIRLVKRKINTRVGYICDNVIPHESRPGDIALTRYAFKPADFFIVQSKTVEQELLSLYGQPKYKRIPHPVYDVYGDLLDRRVARDRLQIENDKVLLFFGYVRAYKGLDLLLQAMPDILKKMSVRLLVVGEFYEDENKYRKMITELGLSEDVLLHSDFVPNEEVSLYFSAADVVVLPYKSATQSGIVQMAYHFDKPCIVTDVGGLAEVVLDGKTGFVVEPDNPGTIADAVVRFYDKACEQRFSAAVHQEKLKYSWENLIDGIIELSQ